MIRPAVGMAALIVLAAGAAHGEDKDQLPPAPEGKTWKLVWHDEFDGTKLDESKWTYRPDGRRKGGWWSRKAVSLDGKGHLVISTFKDGDKPTDGCITTQGKFEHAFGYYVARVEFQKQPGHWSAFWMYVPRRRQGRRRGPRRDRDRHHGKALARRPGAAHPPLGRLRQGPQVARARSSRCPASWRACTRSACSGCPTSTSSTWTARRPGGPRRAASQVPEYILLSDEIGDGAATSRRRSCPTSSWSITCGCTTAGGRKVMRRPGSCSREGVPFSGRPHVSQAVFPARLASGTSSGNGRLLWRPVAASLADQGEEGPDAPYKRANTDWLAECRFGVGIHWTAQTVPRQGSPAAVPEGGRCLRPEGFIEAVEHAGADYVLFTAAHALQMLPAPHPVIDKILPGRTCKRDLIGELADALAARKKHLLVYYNHSCNHGKDDPAWERAVGYHGRDKAAVRPEPHGHRRLDGRPVQGQDQGVVVRQPVFPRSPWPAQLGHHGHERLSVPVGAVHRGRQDGASARLVTYNAGVNQTFLYTTHQDYWAGELVNLKTPAKSRYLKSGLQWFGWTCLEDRALGASPAEHRDSQAALLR